MKFSVPHNWQPDLVDSIDTRNTYEFYGRLEPDILGGGLPSNICPSITRRKLGKEVKKIHNKGICFNYIVSGMCLDNQELTHLAQHSFRKLLEWLRNLAVDYVTVSMPYLLSFIKANYPEFKVCVSTMAQVNSSDKARFWEDLGADKITLSETSVNRDFGLLRSIRRATKCHIQLIANNACLYECPFVINHGLLGSHSSQKYHATKGFVLDFYRLICTYLKIKDPVNFIRADWIRPEDVGFYEDLGVDYIKIVNRGLSTNALKRIVMAYNGRRYDGNLMDLFPGPSKNINYSSKSMALFRFFFRPFSVNIFRLLKLKEIAKEIDSIVYIDNRKLDGFLTSLADKDCGKKACSECRWCKEKADEVIKIDKDKLFSKLENLENFLDDFMSGRLFRYF